MHVATLQVGRLPIAVAFVLSLLRVSSAYADTITLMWDPNSDPVTGYAVYVGSSRFDVGNTTSYTMSTAVAGQQYCFAVAAYNANGEGPRSGQLCGYSNQFPTLTNPGNRSATVGQATSLQLSGSDPDGRPLTYAATGMPPGLFIGSATGFISGTPTTAGTYSVTASVFDGVLTSPSQTFTWTVAAGSTPDTIAPSVSIATPTSAASYTSTATSISLGGTASDNVGVSSVSWVNNRGGSGTATGTTSWNAATVGLQTGTNVITVTARDVAGNVGTDILTVTYTAPDTTAPIVTITAPTAGSSYATSSSTIAISGTGSDNVGVTQVSWVVSPPGSASDDYDRPDSPTLGANWTCPTSLQLGIANSGKASATSNTGRHFCWWNVASIGGDQFSSATVGTAVTFTTISAVGVRFSGTTNTTYNGYTCTAEGDASNQTSAAVFTNGTRTELASWTLPGGETWGPGDVLRAEIVGNTLSCYYNSTLIGSVATGGAYTTGQPMVGGYGGGTLDDFSAGILPGNPVTGTASGTASWTAPGVPLQSGANVFTVTARDAAGNLGRATLTVTYTSPDTSAPAIAILGPTSSPNYSTTSSVVTLGGTSSDDRGVTAVTWANNRGGNGFSSGTTNWSVPSVALQGGTNVITMTAQDAAGNRGTATLTVTYNAPAADTTPPAVSITSPTSAATFATNSPNFSIGGSASDNAAVTQVTWQNNVGGSGVANGTAAWNAAMTLQPGANMITVTALDAVGNRASDVLTVTYNVPDTTPPTVAIASPTAGDTYAATSDTPSLPIGGTTSDNAAVTQVTWQNSLGGSGVANGTTSWNASVPMSLGTNVITVTAIDAAGNRATDVLTVTYTVAPAPAPGPVPPSLTLSGRMYSSGRWMKAYLQWSSVQGRYMDIFLNGTRVDRTSNDGSVTENPRGSGPFYYRVCVSDTSTCSNTITLTR